MKASLFVGLTAAAALAMTGCVANTPAPAPSSSGPASESESAPPAAGVLTVTSTDTECTLSANTAASGNATFQISNTGGKITEFYLLGADGLRIVAEKENIAPGASADLPLEAPRGPCGRLVGATAPVHCQNIFRYK